MGFTKGRKTPTVFNAPVNVSSPGLNCGFAGETSFISVFTKDLLGPDLAKENRRRSGNEFHATFRGMVARTTTSVSGVIFGTRGFGSCESFGKICMQLKRTGLSRQIFLGSDQAQLNLVPKPMAGRFPDIKSLHIQPLFRPGPHT